MGQICSCKHPCPKGLRSMSNKDTRHRSVLHQCRDRKNPISLRRHNCPLLKMQTTASSLSWRPPTNPNKRASFEILISYWESINLKMTWASEFRGCGFEPRASPSLRQSWRWRTRPGWPKSGARSRIFATSEDGDANKSSFLTKISLTFWW